MKGGNAIISFTFDDFPRSALHTAGRILEENGIAGTYYTSLGLMGTIAPTGEQFIKEDLHQAFESGHELGCHTFAHCHATETPTSIFEASIVENRRALRAILPASEPFRTLSYPIGSPRPKTKNRCARHFAGCRAGGQTFNSGAIDLNLIQAFFIEQSRDQPEAIKAMIDAASAAGAWLIFATHDVCDTPTRYGITPALFDKTVQHAVRSGARLLPVYAALEAIGVASSQVILPP